MSIEVLAVGDELLTGATQETNARFVARELFALGLALGRVTVVGDDESDLRAALVAARERCRVLVVTGGLGPTVDDRTKEVAARLLGDPLVLDTAVLDGIRARFAARGRVMPEINRKQALMPQSAAQIPNPIGSAPGVHWSRDGRELYLLPGVPAEMRAMFRATVLPQIAALHPDAHMQSAVFRTVGIAESELAERLAAVTARTPDVTWAFYPSWGAVDVKLRRPGAVAADWDVLRADVRAAIGPSLFSEVADEPLAEVVRRALAAQGATLAVAESCTGGLVAAQMTDVSGASAVFTGGSSPAGSSPTRTTRSAIGSACPTLSYARMAR
jgi:nicotinamide-nucleotide amidase